MPSQAVPSRVAVYACPCCGGSASLPLQPGQRPPARRACPNGGCWSCLGACRDKARRTETVKLRSEPDPLPAMTGQAGRSVPA